MGFVNRIWGVRGNEQLALLRIPPNAHPVRERVVIMKEGGDSVIKFLPFLLSPLLTRTLKGRAYIIGQCLNDRRTVACAVFSDEGLENKVMLCHVETERASRTPHSRARLAQNNLDTMVSLFIDMIKKGGGGVAVDSVEHRCCFRETLGNGLQERVAKKFIEAVYGVLRNQNVTFVKDSVC